MTSPLDTHPETETTHIYLGGTFDPVHNGHLRMLIDAALALGADSASFCPCHVTPHKSQPLTSASHRQGMLLSVAAYLNEHHGNVCDWSVEPFELERDQASYSWHTVRYLRDKHGPKARLVWLVGMDSLASLNTWFRWRELLDYVHIGVFRRPGAPWPHENKELMAWWDSNTTQLKRLAANNGMHHCFEIEAPQLEVSSTDLRNSLFAAEPCIGLMPAIVERYIYINQLYRHYET